MNVLHEFIKPFSLLLLKLKKRKRETHKQNETYQSVTALNDSSLVISYIKMNPMAPR